MTTLKHTYSEKFPMSQAYAFMNGDYHEMKKADATKCIDQGHAFTSKELIDVYGPNSQKIFSVTSAHDYWVQGTKFIDSLTKVDSEGHVIAPDLSVYTFSVEYTGECS